VDRQFVKGIQGRMTESEDLEDEVVERNGAWIL
jgi:hypothetical protein